MSVSPLWAMARDTRRNACDAMNQLMRWPIRSSSCLTSFRRVAYCSAAGTARSATFRSGMGHPSDVWFREGIYHARPGEKRQRRSLSRVLFPSRGDDHFSRTPVTRRLERLDPGAGRAIPLLPYSALLRVGFTEPARSPASLVSSYLTVS